MRDAAKTMIVSLLTVLLHLACASTTTLRVEPRAQFMSGHHIPTAIDARLAGQTDWGEVLALTPASAVNIVLAADGQSVLEIAQDSRGPARRVLVRRRDVGGIIAEVTADSIRIRPDGVKGVLWEIERAQVEELRARRPDQDPVWNGLLLGTGIGAGINFAFAAHEDIDGTATSLGVSAGVGALLGAIVDGLREGETEILVYRGPQGTRR